MIRIAISPSRRDVVFDYEGPPNTGWREIRALLFAAEGRLEYQGLVVPILGFRRIAVDIANIITAYGLPLEYDEAVESLFRHQLEEIEARQRAVTDPDFTLSPEEVQAAISASGRFTRCLINHQLRDIGRLLHLHHGANFSVPGAGKTTALLAIYEAGRVISELDKLLVVSPKNAFISWEDEIRECYDPSRLPQVARLGGGAQGTESILSRDPEIALLTYHLLPNVLDIVRNWAGNHSTHIVLDESHRIKGGLGRTIASSAIRLADVAQRRDILSGTPLPHSPEDLRAQFDFLWPGQRILPQFRMTPESPIEIVVQVQERVSPLYVRTTKQELNLPPLTILHTSVNLGPLQRELYDILRSEARRLASGMSIMDRRFFRELGRHVVRLLQAASNPMLLTHGDLFEEEYLEETPQGVRVWELFREIARYEQPAKVRATIDRTREIISEDSHNKVLIWSSFVRNILSLEQLLSEFNPVILYGAVGTGSEEDLNTREGRIRRFHDDETCRVMIANPAAGGEGVNLHNACHFALYLDRTYNAAHYLQSVDRIHRLGLPQDVETIVEIFEAHDTIDHNVTTRLNSKLDVMAQILNDPELLTLSYAPEDVMERVEFPGGIEPGDVEHIVDHLLERNLAFNTRN